jgi:hypothetical protein
MELDEDNRIKGVGERLRQEPLGFMVFTKEGNLLFNRWLSRLTEEDGETIKNNNRGCRRGENCKIGIRTPGLKSKLSPCKNLFIVSLSLGMFDPQQGSEM